ncbi:MAG: ATP-binding protein [Clostridiales bacterium]|nr:ATP-binding protein [Candidatus Cacconaster stercorequi]
MGIPVLVMGESGSGKTYSIRNFASDEIGIFSVEKGRLPFNKGDDGEPRKFGIVRRAKYDSINKAFEKSNKKVYIIDDSQYLLVNEFFDRAKETGYQKFTDMALKFRNLIHDINEKLPDDVIVYFLHHVEYDSGGKLKAKTIGKMLDEKLTVEGCFDIVLHCLDDGGEHYFLTQGKGLSTAKSPAGMFQERIPNDLKSVDTAIREYWQL